MSRRRQGCWTSEAHGWREVLEPVVSRYRDRKLRRYFRADAAFASPEVYEFLEAESFLYAIRLPANRVLQQSIAHLLRRPVGRPPKEVRRYHASFSYKAQSWRKSRRARLKKRRWQAGQNPALDDLDADFHFRFVPRFARPCRHDRGVVIEWHPGELFPRVGFIVTNLSRPAERVIAFYNQRGTAEQYIKEGKKRDQLDPAFLPWLPQINELRLQLHALAYNLGNFLRTLASPDEVEHCSLTTLREKLIKIGAKLIRHGRYITFQMAEVAIPRALVAEILGLIDWLRPAPLPP